MPREEAGQSCVGSQLRGCAPRTCRKVTIPAAGLINDSVRTMVQRLAGPAQSTEPVDMYQLFKDLTLDVIGRAAFGSALGKPRSVCKCAWLCGSRAAHSLHR